MVTNALESGGAETHILALVKGLLRRGYHVSVVSAGGALEKELTALGATHTYAPLESPLRVIESARILKNIIREQKIDILHAHSRLAALACRLTGYSRRRRFVTTAHLDFKTSFLTRRLSFWGEKTLAVSEDIRDYLIREYKLSYENIRLTVNGIDTERFCSAPDKEDSTRLAVNSQTTRNEEEGRALTPGGGKRLLHVSRLDRDRAYTAFLLCDIAALLHEAYGVTVIILGGGELYDKLRAKAEAICRLYGPILHLPGAVEDVAPYLQEADLFVGVSRAALEAMACEVPTILSGNSGYMGLFQKDKLAEGARTNFCCRGCPPATRSALLHDIEALLKAEPEALAAIGKEGRAVVEAHYSLDKMVSDYVALYDSLRPFRRKVFNKIAVLGYHGFGNLGDEAVLEQMIAALKKDNPERGITVLSHAPRQTEQDHGVSATGRFGLPALIALSRADTVYVGGGTLLQKESSHRSLLYYTVMIGFAKLCGAKIAYWANGLDRYPGLWQPIVASLLSGKTALTLRDSRSFSYACQLFSHKPKAPFCAQVADSAFLLTPCDSGRLRTIRARYKLKNYALFATNGCITHPDYPTILVEAARFAYEKGDTPLLLLMHPKKDRPLAERVALLYRKRYGQTLPILAPSYREAMGLIGGASILFSSRLHALIFAAVSHTPTLTLGSEKCTRFAADLFGAPYALLIDTVEAAEPLYALQRLYESQDALRALVAERVEEEKTRAARTPTLLSEALCALESSHNNRKRRKPVKTPPLSDKGQAEVGG